MPFSSNVVISTFNLNLRIMFKPSIAILLITVFFFYSCSKSQEKTELVIQLSEVDFIYSLSINPQDSVFVSALNTSKQNFNPEKENFVDVLAANLLKTDPSRSLYAYFATFELKDKIKFNSTNQEVITVLKDEVKLANQKTLDVLKKRLETSFTGTSFVSKLMDQPTAEIKETGTYNKFSISINRKVNKDRIKSLVQRRADLGFWETYKLPEIFENLNSVNETLKNRVKEAKPDFKNQLGNLFDSINNEDPLFNKLTPSIGYEKKIMDYADVGVCKIQDTALVSKLLSLKEIKALLPRDLKLMWDIKPAPGFKDYLKLYAIKIRNRDGNALLDGSCIVEASGKESNHYPVVLIKMNAEGAKIWARITKENVGRQIAVVVNQKVFTCPVVNSEIPGGSTELAGNFTLDEVNDLATMLNAGVMPKIRVKVLEVK
jgi:SecD/SecF fusion protein